MGRDIITNHYYRTYLNYGLLIATIIVYLYTVLNNLVEFPPYFFCDEAAHGVEANSLIKTGGYDTRGQFLPLFFYNFGEFTTSLSVYIQAIFVFFIGHATEYSIRLQSALFGFLGACFGYFYLRNLKISIIFSSLIFSILAITPFWYSYTRTGFESTQAASWYIGGIIFYIFAFSGKNPWYILISALSLTFCFYTHTAGRAWVALLLPTLFLFNLASHIKYWKRTILFAILMILFLLPYTHFLYYNFHAATARLTHINADFSNILSPYKILNAVMAIYYKAFDYKTWFHNQNFAARHYIPNFPQIMPEFSICIIFGIFYFFYKFQDIKYRSILLSFLLIPLVSIFNASDDLFGYTRALPMAPLMIIMALAFLGSMSNKYFLSIICSLCLLSATYFFNQTIFTYSIQNYTDYKFYGVQYGSPQIFHWIKDHYSEYEHFGISNELFNGGDIFIDFYEVQKKAKIIDHAEICHPKPNVVYFAYQTTFDECSLTFTSLFDILAPNKTPLISIKIYKNDKNI